ncbi:MAG: hypothetical protein ABIR39_12230 [Nocardioides sp.]|uniref:hypothetical protein n=1 Tax=Nocardioides sp. TaxID=35761 RepID=UPI0032678842
MIDPAIQERLDLARAELRMTVESARTSLEAAQRTLPPTREETEEFERAARSGDLGRDMQELAARVDNRETRWSDVFDGTSPFVELLRSHLDAMGERYVTSVRQSLEDDETFDPAATSSGV